MKYKYSLQEARKVGRPGVPGYAYSSKENFEGASAGVFSTQQRHGRIKNVRSDRLYLILEGQGEFIVGDEVIPVAKDDVLIIPLNTEYDYHGQLRLFLVHIPAYQEGSDINIEPPPSQ